MTKLNLIVQSKYIDLEGGFWGLIDQEDKNYLPINFPEQLKMDGQNSEVTLIVRDDMESMMQWGTIVEITGFETT